MPSVVLRYRGNTPDLIRAIESLGRSFDRVWEPGTSHGKRLHTDFGFNLCLLADQNLSARECVAGSMQSLGALANELKPLGFSLRGASLDIGLFVGPEVFNKTVALTATQAADLAAWGIDFEITFYASR